MFQAANKEAKTECETCNGEGAYWEAPLDGCTYESNDDGFHACKSCTSGETPENQMEYAVLECTRCHGDGFLVNGHDKLRCPVCHGEGTLEFVRGKLIPRIEVHHEYR